MDNPLTPAIESLSDNDDNFILSREYAAKYGMDKRAVSVYCYHSNLIAKKLPGVNPSNNRKLLLWHVLDIPPNQHPNFNRNLGRTRRSQQTIDRKSTRLTPVTLIYLVCRLLLEKKKKKKEHNNKK